MNTAQTDTGRGRRTPAQRFESERRSYEAEALRAAARDLPLTDLTDTFAVAEWLTRRAERIEHPEPRKSLHALVFAAMVIALVGICVLGIIAIIQGDFSHLRPM